MSKLKIRVQNNPNTWYEVPAGGVGVPSGGTQGQVLYKTGSADYATGWGDVVTSVNGRSGDVTVSADDIGLTTELILMPQMSLPANGTASISESVAKTGYTPVGIVGITGSGTSGCNLMEFFISDTTAYVWANNNTSSAKTPTYRVRVLYVRA